MEYEDIVYIQGFMAFQKNSIFGQFHHKCLKEPTGLQPLQQARKEPENMVVSFVWVLYHLDVNLKPHPWVLMLIEVTWIRVRILCF